MPGEEDGKVRGNQNDKKGKSSGAPVPLLAVMAQVPKASAKGNKKGASHTHAVNKKGASHTQASEGMKDPFQVSGRTRKVLVTPLHLISLRRQRMMVFSLA